MGQFKRLFRGRKVRLLSAYGNFSNVLGVVRAIARASAGWTLYEHTGGNGGCSRCGLWRWRR